MHVTSSSQLVQGNGSGEGVSNVLFNMSVWESREALLRYTYREIHGSFLKRRSEWFEPAERDTFVLWWIDAGHIPSPDEAMDRFDLLWREGATPRAFTLRAFFDAVGRASRLGAR